MAATLTRDDVRRVAALAHLTLTESEVEAFAAELGAILEWVDAIQSVETRGVDPTLQAAPMSAAAWREDAVTGSLATGDVVDAAPDAARDAGLFRVPSVF
jgi:aspartyl-tRNA(Asn)/glutamyl-tRNA(Gln) amidotransferase subunit C